MNTINKSVPTIRFTLSAAALLAFLFLAPTQAHALRAVPAWHDMTPAGLQESGFSMKAENQKDGMVAFTLTRDLSKVQSPRFSLQVARAATLEVIGKSGLLAKCSVEPTKQNDTITYRFMIARDCVPDSHFTLGEVDDFKDKEPGSFIGGGDFYKFRLAHFAEHPTPEKAPK